MAVCVCVYCICIVAGTKYNVSHLNHSYIVLLSKLLIEGVREGEGESERERGRGEEGGERGDEGITIIIVLYTMKTGCTMCCASL